MATYLQDTNRGRVLHLVRLDTRANGQTGLYLDATSRVKEAERADAKAGYSNGGPNAAIEIVRARDYADYVADYATSENAHHFNGRGYLFFTEKAKAPAEAKKPAKATADVRTHVSV